jgi:preprotein translocase subunit SecD
MYKNLRWKIITIAAVFVVFFALGVYPILAQRYHLAAPGWLMAKQLKLGLDLKGGVHLVLRVNRDDALRISTESVSEALREALQNASITVSNVNVTSPTTFQLEGVPQDKDAEFRRIADEHTSTDYQRDAVGGGTHRFTMKPNIVKDMYERTMVQALDTIDRALARTTIRSSCSCQA